MSDSTSPGSPSEKSKIQNHPKVASSQSPSTTTSTNNPSKGSRTHEKTSKKEKSFQKSLKAPDAFQTQMLKSVSLMEKFQKPILIISATVLAFFLISVSIKYFKGMKTEKIRNSLAAVEKIYQQEQTEFEELWKQRSTQLESLKNQKSELEKNTTNPDKAAIEAKEKEINDAQSALDALEPNHSKSSGEFLKFYTEHSNAPEGYWAGMRHATFLVKQNKKEEALEIITKIVDSSKELPIYQTQGRLMMLSLLEDLKSFEKADKVAAELVKQAPKELIPRVLLAQSRLLLAQNKQTEAQGILDTIIKDHSQSKAEVDTAKAYQALLKLQ